MSNTALSQATTDTLFGLARSHADWTEQTVDDSLLKQLYDLAKWGPTSMNCLPMRLVFIKTVAAKAQLLPCLSPGNVPKIKTAPVTVIIAQDTQFYRHMPTLFPYMEQAEQMFSDDPELAQSTAFRNSSLQGAYMLIAARSLGLDTGAMSGFDQQKLDDTFFPDGLYQSNFIMNIGYANHSTVHPRGPRFTFEQVARII